LLFFELSCGGPDRAGDRTDPRIARVEARLVPYFTLRQTPDRELGLRARMTYYRVPAVSVAVIDDGRLAWARAWGAAERDGPPVSTKTIFQAGSVSKPVTAAAALRLVERGAISLDEDVSARLHSWNLPSNAFTKR